MPDGLTVVCNLGLFVPNSSANLLEASIAVSFRLLRSLACSSFDMSSAFTMSCHPVIEQPINISLLLTLSQSSNSKSILAILYPALADIRCASISWSTSKTPSTIKENALISVKLHTPFASNIISIQGFPPWASGLLSLAATIFCKPGSPEYLIASTCSCQASLVGFSRYCIELLLICL